MLWKYFGVLLGLMVVMGLLTAIMLQNEPLPASPLGDGTQAVEALKGALDAADPRLVPPSIARERAGPECIHLRGELVTISTDADGVEFTLVLQSKEAAARLTEAKARWMQEHPDTRLSRPDEWDPAGYPPPAFPHFLRIHPE